MISQRFGAGDMRGARKAYAAVLELCVGLIILYTVLLSLVIGPLLHLVQTPDELFTDAKAYMMTLILGLVCTDHDYAKGVMEAGAILWYHYHSPEIHAKLLAEGAKVVRVIKPMRDIDEVLCAIKYDTEHGALGYSMDISHGMNVYGELDAQPQAEFGPKSIDDIKRINDASKLPFYPKDVMSVRDALILKEIGVAGVVLSGHNNRFPCAVPPLKILEDVRAAVGDDFKIFVDGGLNNGYDAFKALALGADGVLSARGLAGAFAKGGSEGVALKILEMNAELKGAMSATCSPDLKSINRDCIIKM